MKKYLLFTCALLILVGTSGCFGPMSLTRKFDDWTNHTYVDSPWLGQVLLYLAVIPVGYILTNVLDFVILNPIDFWGVSAFRGYGTKFQHINPIDPTEK